MAKYDYIQYYVEGDDEKKLIDTLKTEMQMIISGKVDVFNVASKIMTRTRLLALKKNTLIVIVFDTDTYNKEILEKNINLLRSMSNICEIIFVLQVKNLEDELVRCCNIKDAKELFKATSNDDFKSKLRKCKNLDIVLKRHKFDISRIWNIDEEIKGLDIHNGGDLIKK